MSIFAAEFNCRSEERRNKRQIDDRGLSSDILLYYICSMKPIDPDGT